MADPETGLTRQRVFIFDPSGCIACRACQMACKDLHDLPVGTNWRRVVTHESGGFPDVRVVHSSVACHHCSRPACVAVCPTGALAKREVDGAVLLHRALCTDCMLCVEACPHGAPQLDRSTGQVGKCDMCWRLLDEGADPTCVSACPMDVLRIGWVSRAGP